MSKRDSVVHMNGDSFYKVGVHDHHICCDCGLTHKVEYQFKKGTLFERWSRDDKLTAKERLKHSIKVTLGSKAAK